MEQWTLYSLAIRAAACGPESTTDEFCRPTQANPGKPAGLIPSNRIQSQKSRLEFLTFFLVPSCRQNGPSKIRE